MADRRQHGTETLVVHRGAPRVAVVGAGIGGLSCARELALRGYDPVVFEASDRVGGRCSSQATRAGWFDDGAQVINGTTRLAAYTAPQPGQLAASHTWTMATRPVDVERPGKAAGCDVDDAGDEPSLELIGTVGVPTMRAMADAMAKPLDVRLDSPIHHAHRSATNWVLQGASAIIDEDFQALVLALPAPLALPLVNESALLRAALRGVRYRSRWVLLLGSERAIHLPNHREFHSGPIERIAAMHSKPGRSSAVPQRWFIEASERWSLEHADDDAEAVADELLANFQAHAGRPVAPHFLRTHNWQHAYVDAPAPQAEGRRYLWDERLLLGVCGDSVVPSRVDQVHRSGALLAAQLADSLVARRWRSVPAVPPAVAGHTDMTTMIHARPGLLGTA
ncbi:FAD-dependent oxidoreductase [Hydrogenophaga sp.]|uniref:FAD-dependent oxidoreductase n=1 Tax=Hydrogenophaga sp. TaxID=1904254 RepID=UPI00271C3964|nr:FAD-dependent oxidoreductase [Hydrogenophaga sp.]MDO9135786.1 FAD-dependent oxidoreductase [Hydrogenophaga sp.]